MKKTSPRTLPYSASDALRHNGFVPLPRLWVKREDIPQIHAIAHAHTDEVLALREKVSAINAALLKEKAANDQDKENAWAIHEQSRQARK